jgi:hypothetical protein
VSELAAILPAATTPVARSLSLRRAGVKRIHLKIHSIHLDDAVDTYDFAAYDDFTVRRELTGQGDRK